MSFSLPRSPRDLAFELPELVDISEDDTTQVIRPGMRRLAPNRLAGIHAPPRAHQTSEPDLPSVMVTRESWTAAPTRVMRRPPSASSLTRTAIRKAPVLPPPARPAGSGRRAAGVVLGMIAVALGVMSLHFVPAISHVVDGALALMR